MTQERAEGNGGAPKSGKGHHRAALAIESSATGLVVLKSLFIPTFLAPGGLRIACGHSCMIEVSISLDIIILCASLILFLLARRVGRTTLKTWGLFSVSFLIVAVQDALLLTMQILKTT